MKAAILLTIAGAVFLIAIGVIISMLINRERSQASAAQLRPEYHDVIVKGGVNVKTQQYGSGKGDYFGVQTAMDATVQVSGNLDSRWHLVFEQVATGKVCQFSFSDHMTIGRLPSDDPMEVKYVIDSDQMISKTHCVITASEAGLAISDNGSRNHTYINDQQLIQPVWLNQNDVIRLGHTVLKVTFQRG